MTSAVVTIVSDGQTATGIRDTTNINSELDEMGEQGRTSGIVRLSAADLTEPLRGQSIIVDGKNAIVKSTRIDSAGAILAIAFQETEPIT